MHTAPEFTVTTETIAHPCGYCQDTEVIGTETLCGSCWDIFYGEDVQSHTGY